MGRLKAPPVPYSIIYVEAHIHVGHDINESFSLSYQEPGW